MHCRLLSNAAIEREYYPNKKFGKIGVLILDEEKQKIEKLAKIHKLNVKILPRIAISTNKDSPKKTIAWQMMGIEEDGNTCPFLDTNNPEKSPHGGHLCKIYKDRPLACSAYPLIESNPITLDQKCKFCKEHKTADQNLNSELESLLKIKEKMNVPHQTIWRFATEIGEQKDRHEFESGWILEK